MTYSIAFTSRINSELLKHLLRKDGQEDLCFALWYPSQGQTRLTAIISEVILPYNDEREVHGNASFAPKYFERVLSIALEKGAGIAFLHSHLGPGWQDMSTPDIRAELGHAPATKSATGYPLVGLTLGTDGSWSARFWDKSADNKKFERFWCKSVRIIGDNGLEITYAKHLAPAPAYREELKRTISAWGLKKQQDLTRLKIGVVGVGSVGSMVAEALCRMGFQRIILIDFDKVERHNMDRILHCTHDDVINSRYKTEVISHAVNKSATAADFVVEQCNLSITEKDGFEKVLDCDIVFSCVDRPWPRSVLNYVAYAHLIPVIDGGIRVKKNGFDELQNADWKAHVAMPTRRCLECLGQYDPSFVQAEREGYLDNPSYIDSLEDNHILKNNQNVFPFSLNLASLQILQMLSLVIKPLGVSNTGEQNYHFVSGNMDIETGKTCLDNCLYQRIIALGDRVGREFLK